MGENLTKTLRKTLAERNITIDDSALGQLVSDFTTGKFNRPRTLFPPTQGIQTTKKPRPASGGAKEIAGDFMGQLTWDFYESATAGLGSEFLLPEASESLRQALGAEESGFLPMGGERTMAQTVGGVIGGAAGFFAPIKWIGLGTRGLVSAAKGTRAAIRIARGDAARRAATQFGMSQQGAKTALKGAIKTKVKTSATSRLTGKPKKFPSYKKQIAGKAGIYESGNALAIQTFESGLRATSVKSLMKQAKAEGLDMTKENAIEISNALIKGIREGRHINTFGAWGAKMLTRKASPAEMGRIGGYITKFADGFVNFGIYNAASEVALSHKEGRDFRVKDTAFNTFMFAAMLPLVEAIPWGVTTPLRKSIGDLRKIAKRKPKYNQMGTNELRSYAQMIMRKDKDHSLEVVIDGVKHTLTREGVASGRVGNDLLRRFVDKWYTKRYKDFRTITGKEVGRDIIESIPRLAVGTMFFAGGLPGFQSHDGQIHFNGGVLDPQFIAEADPAEFLTHALVGAFFTKRRKPLTKEKTEQAKHYRPNYQEQLEMLRLMGSAPRHVRTMVEVMEIGEEEGLWGAGLLKQPTMKRVKEIFDEYLQSEEYQSRKEAGVAEGEITEDIINKAFNKYFSMKSAEAAALGVSDVDQFLPSPNDLKFLKAAERSDIARKLNEIIVNADKEQTIKDVGWETAEVRAENEVAETNIRLLEDSAIAFANTAGLKYRDNRGKKDGKIQFEKISGSEGGDLGSFNEYHKLIEILTRIGRAETMSTKEGKNLSEITPRMKEEAATVLSNLKRDTITSTLGSEADIYIDAADNRMIDGVFDHHRKKLYERIFDVIENRADVVTDKDKPILRIFEEVFGTADTKVNDKLGSYRVVDRTGKATEEEIAGLQESVDSAQVLAVQSKRQVRQISRNETIDIDVARRLQKLMKERGFSQDMVFEDTVTLREEVSRYLWERGRGSLPPDVASILDYLTVGSEAIFPRVTSEGGRQGISVPNKETFRKMLIENESRLGEPENRAELKEYMEIYEKLYKRLSVVKDLVIDAGDEGMYSRDGYLRDAGREIDVPLMSKALKKIKKLLDYNVLVEEPLHNLFNALDSSKDGEALDALGKSLKNRFLSEGMEWNVASMESSIHALTEMANSKRLTKAGLKDVEKIIEELENAVEAVKEVEASLTGQFDGSDERATAVAQTMQRISGRMSGVRDRALAIQSRDILQRTEAQKVILQMLIDGRRAVNRPQVSNMLGQLRSWLLGEMNQSSQKGRSEEQLLEDFVQNRGWGPLQEYLQTVRVVNQKLVNPEAAARYEQKIAEESSAFLSRQAAVSASVNPNTIAVKHGGIMLNKETGNFDEKLRERIVRATLEDTERLGADLRKKIPTELIDVLNEIINDVKQNTTSRSKELYDTQKLEARAGETVEEAVIRHSNEVVDEFVHYEIPKMVATIVNTTKPIVFTYNARLKTLVQDPDAVRMRGSIEEFSAWINPEGEPKLTNISYLSAEGITTKGRRVSIHQIENVSVEDTPTDFKFTAEMSRSARKEGDLDRARDLTEDRAQDGIWRRLAVSQGDDMLYDATMLSENQTRFANRVRTWYDEKLSTLSGPQAAGFERLFRRSVESVESNNLNESRSEERVLMRAMYYNFINTKGFNDLMGSRNIEEMKKNAASVFKYAHLSEKRNATAFDPIIENAHERLIREHIDPNDPLAVAYSDARAKGYKFDVGILPDEIANHPLFGARQQILRQLGDALADLTSRNQQAGEAGQSIRDMIDRINAGEYASLEETTSNMDGAAYLGTGAAHIAFAQQGAGLGEGRGGVKPLIHHNSDTSTLIGKQNFFYDPVLATYMDAKGIDILMGQSSAKFHTGTPIEGIGFNLNPMLFSHNFSFMENLGRGIESNYDANINALVIDHADVSTSFSPKALERGRVVDAIHNWMSTSESSDLVKYMGLPNNIDLIMQDAQKLSGVARNAEVRKLLRMMDETGAFKEYGSHSMVNKMINWGLDTQDILIQKQILRMFNKQTIGKLSAPSSENAGTSVFTPNPDLKLPTYRVMNFQERGDHRRQTTYGEILLPNEAAGRITHTDYRDIPIIFATNNGTGQDIVRIWNKETNSSQFYDQTIGRMSQGRATSRMRESLQIVDTILKDNVSRLTAQQISDLVQGTGPSFRNLPSHVKAMWEEKYKGLAGKKYGEAQKKLKSHNAMVGHVSLRIPRQQMGDMVINRVKGYNQDPLNGNVVGVNSLDVLTKHQGDFDVDKLFWYGDAPRGVWKMALRTSGLTIEPHPYAKSEWRADLFENEFNMTKSAGTLPLDTINNLKANQESNKRLIGRIVRMNHSLTFLHNVGLQLGDAIIKPSRAGFGQESVFNRLIGDLGFTEEGEGGIQSGYKARQVMAQRLNDVASTILDHHKGASKLAYASEQEVMDYILFNRLPTGMSREELPAERLHGRDSQGNEIISNENDRGIFKDSYDLEGSKMDVTRDIIREMIMTTGRPQRVFSGVFDETGQRQPEYWELQRMQGDMRSFYDNPNAYIFHRLWRRYGYSADGKRDSEKQSALLDMFFRNDRGGSRYRDIKQLEMDIFDPKVNVSSKINRVIRFDGADNYDQFMQSSPATYSLKRLGESNIFSQGSPNARYDLHPYLKNVMTLNQTFSDNVALLRATREPGEEIDFVEMDKLWNNITTSKFEGDKIGAIELKMAQKRNAMHQIIESDRRQIEGYIDYLYSERFVNETRLDRLVDKYNNLKQMESYFEQRSIKDFVDPEAFGKVEEGADRWANINVLTGKGRKFTNPEKTNKIVYEVRFNYDKQANDIVGKSWTKKNLAGFDNTPDAYNILKNPIVLSPGFSTYLKRGRKYVILNNPIRTVHMSDYQAQDGLAALAAIETYNPESFRVPLEDHMVRRFYDDVDATYNAVKRITTQSFKAFISEKVMGNEVYAKSAIDTNYWLDRLFTNYGRRFEDGQENPFRIQDIYESLIQPEPISGDLTMAGGQAYPLLRQNARVVNAINRWMIEKGGAYEDAVQHFSQRKGIILRRMRDSHAGKSISEDLSFHSAEYTNSRASDFNELGEHKRMIYDVLNDPLRLGSLGSFETSLDLIKPGWDINRTNKNKVVVKMIDGSEQVIARYGTTGFRREGDVNIVGGRSDPFERAKRKREQGECFKG